MFFGMDESDKRGLHAKLPPQQKQKLDALKHTTGVVAQRLIGAAIELLAAAPPGLQMIAIRTPEELPDWFDTALAALAGSRIREAARNAHAEQQQPPSFPVRKGDEKKRAK